jgi:hypothetical protein
MSQAVQFAITNRLQRTPAAGANNISKLGTKANAFSPELGKQVLRIQRAVKIPTNETADTKFLTIQQARMESESDSKDYVGVALEIALPNRT